MIGEPIEMRGKSRIRPPAHQTLLMPSRAFEKGDFPHLRRTGNIVMLRPDLNFFAVGDLRQGRLEYRDVVGRLQRGGHYIGRSRAEQIIVNLE